MNRRIAIFSLAAVATLGLAGCAGPSAEDTTTEDTSNAAEEQPAEETQEASGADQSVAEACEIVSTAITEGSAQISELDISNAASDPQGTVDAFTATVDSITEAANSVTNDEVKAAASDVAAGFGSLRDLLQAVLVDQDLSAASDMATLSTDITESATALNSLCTAG